MISANLLFEEQIRIHFEDRKILRMYRFYLIILSLSVLVTWPSNSISYYLQFNSRPFTLPFTFMLMFILAFILAMAPEYDRGRGRNSLADWILYTPIHTFAAYSGRFLFFVAHSLFLLILPAPLLFASATASGLKVPNLFAAISVVMVFCVFFKALVSALQLVLYKRVFLRAVIVIASFIFAVLLSIKIYPPANPFLAVQPLLSGTGPTLSLDQRLNFPWTTTLVVYGAATVVVALISVYKLSAVRRENRGAQ